MPSGCSASAFAVGEPEEVRGCEPVAGEARVEVAVGLVTGQGEVPLRLAGDDEIAICIQRQRMGPVGAPTEVGGQAAITGKRGVESAVAVVTDQGEVQSVSGRLAMPATTIFPSGWIATACAELSSPKRVVTIPRIPNERSRAPSES